MAIFRIWIALALVTLVVPGKLAWASSAESEGGSGGKAMVAEEKPNPMAFNPDLAIFTGIVFLVLMLVLSKFAWGPIASGLEKREHAIAENIAAAERANKEAHEVLSEYEKKLAGTQDQIRAMLDEGRRDAERTKESILAEAKAGAQAEKDRGVREIEIATDKALKELAEQSANIAVSLASKIIQQKLSTADHAKLVQDAVGKLTATTPSRN